MNTTFADTTVNVQQSPQYGIFTFMSDHTYLVSLVATILGLYFLANHYTPKTNPDEPPLVTHPIPLFGHLLGIILHGIKYFDDVGRRTNHPIFTLPILTSKTYVITSPSFVTSCMRETRTMSFNPFVVEVFRRMAHLPAADMEITKSNMDDKSKTSYMTDMHRVEYASLAPGPALDRINEIVLNDIALQLVQRLPFHEGKETTVPDLWDMVRDIASSVALRTIYGPQNPFDKDPSLLQDFWCFENNLKYLLLDFYPQFTVRKAHQARRRLVDAFIKYFLQDKGHLEASDVVRERWNVAQKWGQGIEIIAALEVGFCLGILANAMPTVFWMLCYIYSDTTLLQNIRDEAATAFGLILSDNDHNRDSDINKGTIKIDLKSDKYIRQSCPLLTSTFHETLRVISSSLSSGRFVLQDTILTSAPSPGDTNEKPRSYLLKAGSTVQIPSHSLHHPPENASISSSPFANTNTNATSTKPPSRAPHEIFSATRFTTLGPKLASEPERSMNGSFRAFGGGSTLCPGRKFAFVEIIGLVLAFVVVWDLHGVRVPEVDGSRVSIAVARPKGLVGVKVRRREGMGGLRVVVGIGSRS